MAEFLIGCTHFGHGSIIQLAKRPFASTAAMDEAMIENWNHVVNPEDTVYHLGDFCWGDPEHYLRQLAGNIIFVRGNHDTRLKTDKHHVHPYREAEFGGRKAVLFHYPIEEWNHWFKGSVHFHCHTHDPRFVTGERRGNVTVEAIGYTPIAAEFAVERLLREQS